MQGPGNRKTLLLLCIIVFFILPVENQGQDRHYSNGLFFEEYNLDHGLPFVTVFAILQDSKGYIWAGNNGCLTRYDGYDLTVYKPSEDFIHAGKIKGSTVNVLQEDQYGNLWFGTDSTGLSRIDPATGEFSHYPFIPDNDNSISDGRVTAIAEDAFGRIWVGTTQGLNAFLFDPENPDTLKNVFKISGPPEQASFRHEHYLLGETVFTLLIDKDDLWIGTSGGLSNLALQDDLFGQTKHRLQFQHFRDIFSQSSSPGYQVTALCKGNNGMIWVGGQMKSVLSEPQAFVAMYTPEADRFFQIKLEPKIKKPINSITQAQNGDLWLATDGEGLKRIAFNSQPMNTPKDSLVPAALDQFDFGMNYGATEGRNRIMDVFEDHSGCLWVGTYFYGLYKLPYASNHFPYFELTKKPGENITIQVVDEDGRKNIWITTFEKGIYKWDSRNNNVENFRHDPNNPYSIPSDYVSTVFEDSQKRLWLSTDKGLCSWDEEKEISRFYEDIPNAPKHNSWFIFEDKNGFLWIAGFYGGAFYF